MKKIRFLREFTTTHAASYGQRIAPELKPGEPAVRVTDSVVEKESTFAAGDEVEILPVPVEGKSRMLVANADRRLGAILDDAVEGVDFEAVKPAAE